MKKRHNASWETRDESLSIWVLLLKKLVVAVGLFAAGCGDDPPTTPENVITDPSLRLSVDRPIWHGSSIPNFSNARADTTYRIPVAWFNPIGAVRRGHLNPELDEPTAQERIMPLQLGFDRNQVRMLVDSSLADPRLLWSGVMTGFPEPDDLRDITALEFWLNDFVSDPSQRRGRMHIDFGDISENFVFFQNNPNRGLTNPHFNREAETQVAFLPAEDDLGFNGRLDDCDGIRSLADNLGIVPIPWPFSDCYIPSVRNADRQHAWANGSEGNNAFDTEDINQDGEFDLVDSYFRYTIDLASLEHVDVDVSPMYGSRDFGSLNAGFHGWRHYKIDLDALVADLQDIHPGVAPPSLSHIGFVRIWFDDPGAPPTASSQFWNNDLQLYDIRFRREAQNP